MILNKIYQGNSLDLLKNVESDSIDLVFTSPPYSNVKKYIDFKGIPANQYVEWFLPYCKEIERIIKPTGSFILNINDKVENGFRHPYVFDLISTIYKETSLKLFERLFWNKMKGLPQPNRFGDRVEYVFWFAKQKEFKFNIDEMRIKYSEKSLGRMKHTIKDRFVRNEENQNDEKQKEWIEHPKGALPTTLINICSETKRVSDNHIAVFPVEFAKYFIKGATNENDVVLDPFMGMGTTAIACEELKRNWIGFELQQNYVEGATKRIEEKKRAGGI